MRRLLRALGLSVAALAAVFMVGMAALPQPASAAYNAFSNVCSGQGSDRAVCSDATTGNGQTTTNNKLFGPDGIMTKGAAILSIFVGVAALFMLSIGSFKYITSAGNATAVSGAKRTIMFSLIGVAVALLAQALIAFVLDRL